jgi:myo-inositol-1(or 4)-monophosphatase
VQFWPRPGAGLATIQPREPGGNLKPTIERLREVAAEAAREGGRELAARLDQHREISFKGGIDLVTDADKASEARIVACVRAAFADHALLAEEGGAGAGTAPYRWIIDPLDGTTNYAHGVPHYCVSVAVEGEDGVLAGAILDPVRGELFVAARGLGATLNERPMQVSASVELGQSLMATGFPYDLWANPERPLTLFDHFACRARGMRRMGSAALDLAYVACGRFDGFFEFKLKAWDVAAGALLVAEAGGAITHLEGGPLDLANADVLASNGKLHAAMLAVVKESLSQPEVP